MPGKFLEFLEHYMIFPEQEEKKADPRHVVEEEVKVHVLSRPLVDRSAEEKRRRDIVAQSRDTIKRSLIVLEDPNLGPKESKQFFPSIVGRVFNDFPLEFTFVSVDSHHIAHEQHFDVIELNVFESWIDELLDFLKKSQMGIVENPVELKQADGTVIRDDGSIAILLGSPEDIKKHMEAIKSLFGKIITHACDELLDQNGNLDQRVVEILGLSEIVNSYETLPLQTEEIKFQVLYSYCTQIILGNMVAPLSQKATEQLATEPESLIHVLGKLGPLTKLVAGLLIQTKVEKNKVGNEVIVQPFSDFFKEKVQESISHRLTNTATHCALELANLTPHKVREFLDADFEKIPLLYKQLELSGLEKTAKSTDIITHKIQFWIDVCDYCRKQLESEKDAHDKKYYMLMMTVLKWLEKKIQNFPGITLKESYVAKYKFCAKTLEQPIDFEQKTTPVQANEVVALKNIKKILEADINLYVINELEKINRLTSSTTATKEFIAKIKNIMLQPEFLLRPSRKFLQGFLKLIAEHQDLALGLGAYEQAFARVEFYQRVQLDASMFEAIFKKMPREIKHYKIFNIFEGDNPKTLQISLHESIGKLRERLQVMASTLSYDEYLKLALEYRSILILIVDGMFNALNSEIKKYKIYMNANEDMVNVLKEYELLMIEGKTTLKAYADQTREIDIDKWEETFQGICDQYIHYVNLFYEFKTGIELLRSPSEGEGIQRENDVKKVSKIKLDYFFDALSKLVFAEDQAILLQIKQYIQKTMPAENFFLSGFDEILGKYTKPEGQQYKRILKAYREALARTNSLLHIESSIKGLHIVAAEISEVKGIDAKFSQLDQLVTNLKAVQSDTEFSVLAQNAYPILASIADALSGSINEADFAENPMLKPVLMDYKELAAKMKNALSMESNNRFDIVKWQIAFIEICETYITYTKFLASSAEVKMTEADVSKLRLGIRDAHVLEVASNPERFKEVVAGSTKSTSQPYTEPDRKTVLVANLKSLEFSYPTQHKEIRGIVEKFDAALLLSDIATAVDLLKKLPAQVIRDISKYSSVGPDVMRVSKIDPAFRTVLIAAANAVLNQMSPGDFAKQWANEEKTTAVAAEAEMQKILDGLKSEVGDLKKKKRSAIVESIIVHLEQLSPIEFIAMLQAEHLAIKSTSNTISRSLLTCIGRATVVFDLRLVDENNIFFKQAVALLNSANLAATGYNSLIGKSTGSAIPALRSAAKLMIQLSQDNTSRLADANKASLISLLGMIKSTPKIDSNVLRVVEQIEKIVAPAASKTIKPASLGGK
jgi:hypothetical protein